MVEHDLLAEHIVAPLRKGLPDFVKSLPDAVGCYDAAGVCQEVFIPAGFVSLIGAAEVVGKPIEADPSLPLSAIRKLRACLQQTLETGQPQACRYDVYREGRLYSRDVRFSRLEGDWAGEALAVFRDITEMRQTELALEAQNHHLHTLVDTLPDGIIQLSADGVYLDVYMPKGFLPALPHDKIVGKTLEQISPPEVAGLLRHHLTETLRTGETQRFEYSIMTPQGEAHRRSQFVKLNAHSVLGVVSDITEERNAHVALEHSRHRLATLLDAMPDSFAVFDRQGVYREAKMPRHFRAISRVNNVINRTLEEVLPAEAAATMRRTLEQAFRHEGVQVCRFAVFEGDVTHYREAHLVRLSDDEVFGILRDVTEQVRDQLALMTSEQRLQAILSAMPDMIARCDREGVLLEIIHEGTFKRSRSGAAIVGKPLEALMSPERVHQVRQRLVRAFETNSVQINEQSFLIHGQTHYREVRYVPLEDGTCLTLFRDITEQKRDQQALIASEQRLQAILSAMPDIIARYDRNGLLLEDIHEGSFSKSYSVASMKGKPLDSWVSSELAAEVRRLLALTLDTNSVQVSEYSVMFDEQTYYREMRFVPLQDGTCLGLIRDVTEAHRAKQDLNAALEHSQALLREVHHRVRNNLQMLSSLLQLHAGKLDNDIAKHALAKNRRRIQTLALVHRVLYDNESYADIALDDFLQAALTLFAADIKHLGIAVELHTEPIAVDLDRAIPFGLIVNELINNVLEHAFVDGTTTSPRLQVCLQKQHQRVTLQVLDNGSGMPDSPSPKQQNLGIMIVNLLAEQLVGSVEISSVTAAGVRQGTQVVLEFDVSP